MATAIPQDIITNHILRHLPSKSVGRFRCVSKEWLSLLTDPQFIKTHQKTLNTNRFIFESPGGLLHSVTYDKNHEDVPTITYFNFELGPLFIQGSANGLVLATVRHWILLVLNLATKDYVELPSSLREKFFGLKGFGYDPVSGDYKFVVFCKFAKYYGNVYLYNLRTNTLELLMSNSPYVDYRVSWESRVLVNGSLHWIFNKHGKWVMVAFSFTDEKLTEFALPDFDTEIDKMGVDTKVFALGGKLAVFNGLNGGIWLMNEYGVPESWTKIVLNGFNDLVIYEPVVFFNSGKAVFLTDFRLWTYDVEKGIFCQSVDNSDLNFRYLLGAYEESLVSPKLIRSK